MRTLFLLLLSVSCFAQEVKIHSFPVIKNAEFVHYALAANVERQKDIRYCDTLKLDVYKPISAKNAISVIIIHGGGWVSGDRDQLAHLAGYLAERGYVCFVPQYRLSDQAKYPAAAHDIQSVVDWTFRNSGNYGADRTKIVTLGFSAGGHLAALAGTTYHKKLYKDGICAAKSPAKIAAVVDIDGILAFIHPESGEGDDTKRLSAATRWFGYPKSFSTLGWEQASPLIHVSSNTPPTLFINSSINRMHAGREDFRKILKENNIYSEVHEMENAPHDFCLRKNWFPLTVELVDNFLKKVFL